MLRTIVYLNHKNHENGEFIFAKYGGLLTALSRLEKFNFLDKKYLNEGLLPVKPCSRPQYEDKHFYEIPGLILDLNYFEIEYNNLTLARRSWPEKTDEEIIKIVIGYDERRDLYNLVRRLGLPYQKDPYIKKRRRFKKRK